MKERLAKRPSDGNHDEMHVNYPNATTRPPCSLTADRLHPGQSLSSSVPESGVCRRSRCECSLSGMSCGTVESIADQDASLEATSNNSRALTTMCHASRHTNFVRWRSSPSSAFQRQANQRPHRRSRLFWMRGSQRQAQVLRPRLFRTTRSISVALPMTVRRVARGSAI